MSKCKWLVLQHLCPIKFVNFGLKAKLLLLNMPTDPRYWVILTGFPKYVKKLSTLLKKVVSYNKLISVFYKVKKKIKTKI